MHLCVNVRLEFSNPKRMENKWYYVWKTNFFMLFVEKCSFFKLGNQRRVDGLIITNPIILTMLKFWGKKNSQYIFELIIMKPKILQM